MYYPRFLESGLLAETSKYKVKLLLGPRQSGKTTLLAHCLADKGKIFGINLQDRRLRMKYERDAAAFLQELALLDRGSTVLVDEIQKVPAILDDIQFIFDEDKERFEFFLTGSSARQLKKRSANLLPGRTHLFHLSPVLQAEQRESELLPLRMPAGALFPMRSLEDWLVFGNLPGLYNEAGDSWAATLTAYAELYIENEIRKESLVNDMGAFLQFLRLAALESGQTVNYSKLASAIGIAVNTVKNYFQILEDTHIGLRIPAFGHSRKKIIEAPRFLVFDTGIRNALAQLPLNATLLQLDAGHLFEQAVLIELHYRCIYHGRDFRLSTWRTATGAEVDAVLETPDEAIPIEIKWTDAPQKKDLRHLETFLDLHGDVSRRAYLICRVDRPRKLSEQIIALPWNHF